MPNTKYILFIMPFGTKILSYLNDNIRKDIEINFDKRYKEIKEKFGDEYNKIYRVDEVNNSDVLSKMYKMIQAADIVVADITGLNGNVMYELGARHALKKKQTIMFRSDSDEIKIPFDISTFTVYSYDDILNKFRTLINGKGDVDSPILKEISNNVKFKEIPSDTNKSIFVDYSNQWNILKEEYDYLNSNKEKMELLKNNKETFHNSETFLQMFALETYKQDEKNLDNLWAAIKILEPLNPTISNNHETLGLACSIYRKIYEHTKNKKYRNLSFDSSRRFISLFRTEYSISSYTMHLLAEAENSSLTMDYIKQEMLWINEMFEFVDILETTYYKHTKNLINAMVGIKCNDYDNDKTSTSSIAYNRAMKNYVKMKGGK